MRKILTCGGLLSTLVCGVLCACSTGDHDGTSATITGPGQDDVMQADAGRPSVKRDAGPGCDAGSSPRSDAGKFDEEPNDDEEASAPLAVP